MGYIHGIPTTTDYLFRYSDDVESPTRRPQSLSPQTFQGKGYLQPEVPQKQTYRHCISSFLERSTYEC